MLNSSAIFFSASATQSHPQKRPQPLLIRRVLYKGESLIYVVYHQAFEAYYTLLVADLAVIL